MTTEKDFDTIVATAPATIRDAVYAMAWGNSWGAESYEPSKTEGERWAECCLMAEMIIDAPSDYGLTT